MGRGNKTKYVLLEFVAIAFLATGGIFVRFCGISPVNCGFYRVFFSLPFLYPSARKHFSLLGRKDIALLLVSGIFFATDIALANFSFHYTSVANVNMLSNLTPLTIVPVTYFVFKEKIPRYYLFGVVVAIIGVFVLIGGKVNPTETNYVGDIMALLASVFYATFLLISYKMRDRIPGSTILFVTGIGSLVTLFIYSSVLEGFQVPSNGKDFLLVLGFSLCMQTIGQGLLTHCQGKVSVNVSSIVCLMQPAFAAFYSWLCFSEMLSLMEIGGIFIVGFGIYLVKLQYKEAE